MKARGPLRLTLLLAALASGCALASTAPLEDEQTLNGDESWELKLLCDGASQEGKIASFQEPVQSVSPGETKIVQAAACDLGKLSVRLERLPIVPVTGMCGYNPPELFELWVNGKKVLANHYLSARCGGASLRDISISSKGITVCDFMNLAPDEPEPALPVTAQQAARHPVICKNVSLPSP